MLKQYRYQHLFVQEPRARCAFYHLRLGELLISASLVEQARDHLMLSQEIFDAIQYSSSGRLQVSLAWSRSQVRKGITHGRVNMPLMQEKKRGTSTSHAANSGAWSNSSGWS